jgi:hypothetical protein
MSTVEIDIIDPSYQMSIAFILLSIGFYFMIFGIGWLKITSILTGFVTFSKTFLCVTILIL